MKYVLFILLTALANTSSADADWTDRLTMYHACAKYALKLSDIESWGLATEFMNSLESGGNPSELHAEKLRKVRENIGRYEVINRIMILNVARIINKKQYDIKTFNSNGEEVDKEISSMEDLEVDKLMQLRRKMDEQINKCVAMFVSDTL